MKKILVVILSLLFVITFTGCDKNSISTLDYDIDGYEVNEYDDANMIILEDTISSTGLTIELNYYGKDEGTTGAWYSLYVYEENKWQELEYINDENRAWIMIAYIVKKNQSNQMSINWENLYGDLSSGKYLLVKEFHNRKGPGDFDIYYLACDFTIE